MLTSDSFLKAVINPSAVMAIPATAIWAFLSYIMFFSDTLLVQVLYFVAIALYYLLTMAISVWAAWLNINDRDFFGLAAQGQEKADAYRALENRENC